MRIVSLSIYDRLGGACIAGFRQHLALRKEGIDHRLFVRNAATNQPGVSIYQPKHAILDRVRRFIRRNRLRLIRRAHSPIGEIFDFRSEHTSLSSDTLFADADIINLQFTQDFIDHPTLFQQLDTKKPIVVTLHEMSMFTGGCSYSFGCRKFENSCGRCPQLKHSRSNDLTRLGWRLRKEAYLNHRNLRFVADSHWVAREARKSSVLRYHPVTVIHYGLDTGVFRPLDREHSKAFIGLQADQPVIGFAAASVMDQRKGMKELLEAIGLLKQKPLLLTWGRNVPSVGEDLAHLHLGNLDNDYLSALAYNASDVFVMPSLEEAFGQTALEAVACGVPVVAFDVGGIPDTVKPGLNGLLIPRADTAALAKGIDEALRDEELRDDWRRQATEWTEEHFSYEKNAKAYISLYRDMLERASS